ncbi:MAG: sugar-phosphatase [Sarcina sp.]
MYKLIALDMDGTVLNSNKEISKRTQDALREARKRGVYVVLASGRPLEGLLKSLDLLELVTDDDYVLSYNGCLVQNTKTKEVISNLTLCGQDLLDLYEHSKNVGVNIHSFSPEKGLITPKHSKYTQVEADINDIEVNVIEHSTIHPEETIVKVMMIDEPEILDAGMSKLPKELWDKYSVAKSTPFFLEFFNKESNKGLALSRLAKHLGIKQEEIIAVGDAMNDFPMIEYAGLSVAMGNAVPEIKEISQHITDTNDNDGVAKVVEQFILI